MEKKFFVLTNAKGEIEKVNYDFCNGKSAKIKIENKLNGMVWYFPTGGNGYNFLLSMVDASISRDTRSAEGFRESIYMYQKIGNRWVEIDNTNFYYNTQRKYNIIIK